MGYALVEDYGFMDFGTFATADAVTFAGLSTITLTGNDYDYEGEAADGGWDSACKA